MNKDIAPLSSRKTEEIIEKMRKLLASEFGVTVQQDHNGAWGRQGTTYVTLRFRDDNDFYEISMQVEDVRSENADEEFKQLEAENK